MTDGSRTFSAEKIALALSGGGSRAIAFHLGCLRALDQVGILDQVRLISSVSGGSVIAALYCQHNGDFQSFEATTRRLLARGLLRDAVRVALTTAEGLKALSSFLPLAVDRLAAGVMGLALKPFPARWATAIPWLRAPRLRRWASRTTILRRALSELYGGQMLAQLRRDRPKLIVVACELQHKSAFYFAQDGVGSWRLGTSDPSKIEIAHAVVASAAFPGLLPALDEFMTFEKGGAVSAHRVILTDGGVYDNLGLAPLWPDRDPTISLHVDKCDRIIACRAGYSLSLTPPAMFWASRMRAVIESIHARAQNFAMTRLYDLKAADKITGFIVPYLGQPDARLAHPPADLVTMESVADYPTDFSSMPAKWIDRLSLRGYQVTLALIAEHWPEVLSR